VVVGVAKLVAGIMSGSSAMLAEAAHSAADTLNQGFLLTSLHQADRPADRDHPFGHGQARYFWSLLAAFGIFVAGGGFSIFEGLLALTHSHHESPLVAYVTLAIAFVAEGTSLARAFWQVRGEARRRHEEVLDHVEIQPRHQRQGGPVRGQRRGDRPDTAEIESRPGVDALLELCTMHMGRTASSSPLGSPSTTS